MKLNFREKGIPKWVQHRIAILSGIFLVSLLFFQILLNREETGEEIAMDDATLPLVEIQAYDRTMGQLHGYRNQMDACYMRDALIPLDGKRQMEISIDTKGYEIEDVSYEVRSLDTQRKIADTPVKEWDQQDLLWTKKIQIENLVDEGEEYLFILILHGEEEDLYYYTRIMIPEEEYAKKCLEFADIFHTTALSDHYEDLASYMETDQYTDKEDLGQVSIKGSVEQVGWKGFDGEPIGEPLVSFTDINDTYASLVYQYQMKEEIDGGINYYNVEEYFKVRYTDQQIYLLDYQRSMEQILDEGTVAVSDNRLDVGVTSGDVEYLSNETGTIVSFVQAGELFTYDQNKKSFTKVYGFIQDPTDARENYGQHNIRILNIDETGNMDFVVYGYMNRGGHEGECGIDLYHYDSIKKEAVEQVFISSTRSYQILNADFSDLLYENANGDFYIMVGGTLAKVGLDDLKTKELIANLKYDQYAVSASGRYVAWIQNEEVSQEISVMDLETEEIRKIAAADGTRIRPLAFMTEDLVYGIVNEGDISTDAAGTEIYPMECVLIVNTADEDFSVIKEYAKDGVYVSSVTKDGYTLYLDRVIRQGDTYVDAEEDTIKDTAGEQNKTVMVEKVSEGSQGMTTQLVMAALDEGESVRSISGAEASLATINEIRSISISATQEQETYFVYVGNRVTMTTQNLNKAIIAADAEMGIVVDNKQRYIWKRGKKSYVNAFNDVEAGASDRKSNTSAGCISAMLEREEISGEIHPLLERGETPMSVLSTALKDKLVVDLTGCDLNQVLFYVSQGTPVYGRTGEDAALLIIGYDAANIIVYHSDSDRYAKMSKENASNLFEGAGNVFISYVD